MTPKVTLIIVNFNAGERLRRCLESLSAQRFTDFETIVVDNASADGSQAAAQDPRFQARLIDAGANLGFAAGNNLAANEARGAWLAFLNPDAYPEPDWLEALVDATARMPDAAAFGSMQLRDDAPDIVDGAGDVFHALGIHYRAHYGRSISTAPAEGECFAPCAAAALIRRDAFERLGGFDERFFCYAEDIDLGFRLRLQGGRCVQIPSARVRHEGSGVSGAGSDFTIYHGHRNRIWAAYKNIPGALFWALAPLHFAFNVMLGLRFLLSGKGAPYFRALKHGYGRLHDFKKDRAFMAKNKRISTLDVARLLVWSPLALATRSSKTIRSRGKN